MFLVEFSSYCRLNHGSVVYRGSLKFSLLYLRRPGGHFGQGLMYSARAKLRP